MKNSQRIVFIIVFILFVICLISTIWLYMQHQNIASQFKQAREGWIKQRQKFIKDLTQTKDNLEGLKLELSSLRDDLGEKKKKVDFYKNKYEELNEESERQGRRLADLEKRIDDKENIIKGLKQENEVYKERFKELKVDSSSSKSEKQNKIKDNFTSKLTKWKEEKDVLKEKLISLRDRLNQSDIDKVQLLREIDEVDQLLSQRIEKINIFTDKLENLMQKSKQISLNKAFEAVSTVELPPIIVNKPNQSESEKDNLSSQKKKDDNQTILSLEEDERKREESGKILLVNQADNFVVINLGKRHGIKENMIFEVYRRDRKIGKIKIIELRDKLCAGEIKKVLYGEIITANDSVKLVK